MVNNVVQMAGWRPRATAAHFPAVVFGAWVEYCNTVMRAWVHAVLHPYG